MKGRPIVLVFPLLLLSTSGCLGIDNMDDLKEALGLGPDAPSYEPPVARASANATEVGIGIPVTFSGDGSSDPQGLAIAHRWDFGDGTNATGSLVTHAWAAAGTFTVTLRVDNSEGLFATDEILLRVLANVRPTAEIRVLDAGGSDVSSALVDAPLSFEAAASDPDGDPLTFAWEFGDGEKADGSSVTHAYARGGRYVVALTVTDDDGATATASKALSINLKKSFSGQASATTPSIDHAVAVDAAVRLVATVTWDATAGVNDLDLRVLDSQGNEVAQGNQSTAPGTTGAQQEKVELTRDILAQFPAGEWKARVLLQRGVQVAYTLQVEVDF
ncbi:MAG: PKD domain-containing protein [Methanobacteriota archaeon]